MRMKMLYAAALAALLYAGDAYGQCCGAGNPISVTGTENSVSGGHFQVSLDYRHSSSDTYYAGSRPYSGDFYGKLESASYDFVNLGVAYGITRRLKV